MKFIGRKDAEAGILNQANGFNGSNGIIMQMHSDSGATGEFLIPRSPAGSTGDGATNKNIFIRSQKIIMNYINITKIFSMMHHMLFLLQRAIMIKLKIQFLLYK